MTYFSFLDRYSILRGKEPLMRSLYIFLSLSLCITGVYARVNGTLDEVDGKTVLTVWGTHAERGYAHGYLLGAEAKELFDEYIIDFVCYGQAAIYNQMRSFFENHYIIEDRYMEEVTGLYNGMVAAGISPDNPVLGRDLDAVDLLVCNCIVDLSQSFVSIRDLELGCSSLSSWGSSTESDSTLAGDLIIMRHMDWSVHPTLTSNHLLMVSIPAEESEHAWISLTYPSFLGCLSGIAETGVSSFFNVGNHTSYTMDEPFYPILFTVRTGFEQNDYNGDGGHTYQDIVDAIEDYNRSSAGIIHVAKNEGTTSHPVIIESNNERGVAVRDVSNNTQAPEDHLIATNHFRLLYNPSSCYRYAGISDSLNADGSVDENRSWNILHAAAGVQNNLHAIQYIPTTGTLKWATATAGSPAHQNTPAVFSVDDLLIDPTHAIEPGTPVARQPLLHPNVPNPFNSGTDLIFSIHRPTICSLAIYSVNGQLVRDLIYEYRDAGTHRIRWDGRNERNETVGNGLYLCRLKAGSVYATRRLIRIH